MSITTTIAHFRALELFQLYDIMALREQVFTLEQNCSEPDFDGLDKQALHAWSMDGDEIFAVARIFPPNLYYKGAVSFGRLAVRKACRGKKHGQSITETMLRYINEHYPNFPIEISAQLYLKSFYENFEFKAEGEVYDEAGIPHIKMRCAK